MIKVSQRENQPPYKRILMTDFNQNVNLLAFESLRFNSIFNKSK